MNATVYIDECGFTGENLADDVQPVFVLASHTFNEGDAATLKRRYFGHVRADEVKHKSLCRRKQHQDAVLAFLAEIAGTGRVAVATAHKRFALALKLVDWFIEPSWHAAGLNLNEHGKHVGLAELIFANMRDARVERAVEFFQRAARSRTPADISECVRQLLAAESAMEFEGLFSAPAMHLGPSLFVDLPPDALDVSFPIALQLCYEWKRRGLRDFAVVHDRSSKMTKQARLWSALLSHDAPPGKMGWGAHATEFPIGVSRTEFGDSSKSDGLQLADVIAGATATWARWMLNGRSPSDYYGSRLHDTLLPILEVFIVHSIWPGEIERWPSTPPDVMDPHAYVGNVIRTLG